MAPVQLRCPKNVDGQCGPMKEQTTTKGETPMEASQLERDSSETQRRQISRRQCLMAGPLVGQKDGKEDNRRKREQ